MPDGLTPRMELTPQFREAPSLTGERGTLRRPGTTAKVTATGFCYSILRVPFTRVLIRCRITATTIPSAMIRIGTTTGRGGARNSPQFVARAWTKRSHGVFLVQKACGIPFKEHFED